MVEHEAHVALLLRFRLSEEAVLIEDLRELLSARDGLESGEPLAVSLTSAGGTIAEVRFEHAWSVFFSESRKAKDDAIVAVGEEALAALGQGIEALAPPGTVTELLERDEPLAHKDRELLADGAGGDVGGSGEAIDHSLALTLQGKNDLARRLREASERSVVALRLRDILHRTRRFEASTPAPTTKAPASAQRSPGTRVSS